MFPSRSPAAARCRSAQVDPSVHSDEVGHRFRLMSAGVALPMGVEDDGVAAARRRDAPVGDKQVGDRETTVRAEHVAAGNPQWSHRYPQDSKTICTRGVG
jgi:hypothetical protein